MNRVTLGTAGKAVLWPNGFTSPHGESPVRADTAILFSRISYVVHSFSVSSRFRFNRHRTVTTLDSCSTKLGKQNCSLRKTSLKCSGQEFVLVAKDFC